MHLAAVLALLALPLTTPARPPGAASSPCQLRGADRGATPARRCLACHDGTAAASVAPLRAPAGLGDHPVEVDYRAARQRARPGALRAPGDLPPAVRLVGGRVTCTTCHAGESPEPAHTALTMQRSALCFACHAL